MKTFSTEAEMDAPDCEHELCEFCWDCHIVGCDLYVKPLKECITHHVNNPRYSMKHLDSGIEGDIGEEHGNSIQ